MDLLDPQHFGFLDPDTQKYAEPRIRIQGQNINQKLQTNIINSQNSNLNC